MDDPELLAYQRNAYRHVETSIDRWMHQQLPGDAYLASLLAYTSGAVVGAAFAAWSPDDPVDLFVDQVERGFRLLSGAFVLRR